MATSEDRKRAEALADAIMAPHVMQQINEREKARGRDGKIRLLRILGICLLIGLVLYIVLK